MNFSQNSSVVTNALSQSTDAITAQVRVLSDSELLPVGDGVATVQKRKDRRYQELSCSNAKSRTRSGPAVHAPFVPRLLPMSG